MQATVLCPLLHKATVCSSVSVICDPGYEAFGAGSSLGTSMCWPGSDSLAGSGVLDPAPECVGTLHLPPSLKPADPAPRRPCVESNLHCPVDDLLADFLPAHATLTVVVSCHPVASSSADTPLRLFPSVG